jgi:RNA polymerase sigma-70 factor (ECF subfamily)
MTGHRAADRQAAEDLFNACYPRLAGWIRRLVDDDHTAHQIACEAFTRLLSRWATPGDPRSYLYLTAANLVCDHARGRKRRAIMKLTAANPPGLAGQPEQDMDLRALIQALPHRVRSEFLLHHAGFSVREIAAMLGRPERAIKADLQHARSRLRAALRDSGA